MNPPSARPWYHKTIGRAACFCPKETMERGIDMRKCLAILLCKVGSFLGGLMGKGSTLPGKLALMLCPDILRQVEVPEHIIAVTGSNGKTSTVELGTRWF